MFEQLTVKLGSAIKKITGQGKIKEHELDEVLKEIRLTLLDSDVNLNVVKTFLDSVKAKTLGSEVLGSLNPGQHITKIVYDEMTKLLGTEEATINLKQVPPVNVMIVGLQGSGKTTFCGKLALHLKKHFKKNSMLIAADVYRPAAKEQLKTNASIVKADFFEEAHNDAVKTCINGQSKARREFSDVAIYDTAGRLHIDVELMDELLRIKKEINPTEILLVVDSMLGQESVKVAEEFHKKLGLTGLVLSKLDGDARGGAALSIRSVTGVPVKFISNGEKLTELEIFYPDRLASRILDLGDLKTLFEKAAESIDTDDMDSLQKKLKKSQFDLNDFYSQLQQIKKLGSMESILKMLPGMGGAMAKMKDFQPPENELKKIEAIINSMTKQEKSDPSVLNGSRRERIAKGSGTTVQDINKFIKQFLEMQKLMKRFGKFGMRGLQNMMK